MAQDESGRTAFFYAAIVMGCVCVLGSFAHYFTTRERVKQTAADESKISFLAAAKMLLSCRSWLLNMLYVICYGMLNLLIMSTINYYATYVLGSAAAATPILAVFLVVSIIATLAATPIDRKLGRRKTMIVSALIYAAGKIWFVLDPYSMGAIYCNGITVAFSMALAFVCFNTNRNNIADLVEWKNGRRIDSLVSTCDNLASKLAKAGANLLMTGVLARAGFDADLPAQPQAAIDTICALLGWVPMLVAGVMLVIVFFHPIEKEMAAMHADAANVIPKEPYLVANLRTSAHQNCAESLAVMKKYAAKYDLDIEVLMQRDASPISNIHSKEYAFVTECVAKQFPDAGIAPYIIMGGTDCRHFHALTENALRFAPVRMTNAQSASCHAVDENVSVKALAEGVRFFKMLLKTY